MHQYSARPVVVEAPGLRDRLRESMRAAHLGVRDLADLSEVDKGTISSWHTGNQVRVRVEKVRMVAGPLGTTAEHLLDMPPAYPGKGSSTGLAADRQLALLRRVAALRPTLEALESPTAELERALATNREKLERLDEVLPELRKLVDDARRVDG